METLKLEFVVKDTKGNVLATRQLDYVDEYDLASNSTQKRIANVATLAIQEAKRKSAELETGRS